jgi:hypothetical protein
VSLELPCWLRVKGYFDFAPLRCATGVPATVTRDSRWFLV